MKNIRKSDTEVSVMTTFEIRPIPVLLWIPYDVS